MRNEENEVVKGRMSVREGPYEIEEIIERVREVQGHERD